LSAGDRASVQALYGPRRADGYEGAGGNDTLDRATRLGWVTDSNGLLSLSADADLTTRTDRDVYRVSAPSLTGGLVVALERAGLSLLTPRVTVYDALGRTVASAVSTDPTGGNLVLKFNGLPLATYYVKVEGASGDVFDVGSYRLNVQSLPVVNNLLATGDST